VQTFDDIEILSLIWLCLMMLIGTFGAILVAFIRIVSLPSRRPMATFKKGNRNVR
jgi:hypothetical protein